jgi:hypothetical protein
LEKCILGVKPHNSRCGAAGRFLLVVTEQDSVLRDESQHDFPAPMPDYSDDGVDLSLFRWMLSLTPAERLEFLDDHIRAIESIRELNAPIG